jgi:hypothetical protein
LDRWYKYVKENKGDKKDTYQSTLNWPKYFNICLCIKRTIHINHRPSLKKLRRRCRQHWKIERKLQETFQEVFSRGRTKLKKEEPQAQE